MTTSDSILDALRNGALVLTANQRAARSLRGQWDQMHQDRGGPTWPTPNVFAWSDWCREQWTKIVALGKNDRLLLSTMQEQSLWQECIEPKNTRSQPAAVSLHSTHSLGVQAASANALLDEYCAHQAFTNSNGNQSVDAFRRWRRAFLDRCEKERFLPASALESALAEAFANQATSISAEKVLFVGFDRFTPAQSRLFAALRAAGCECEVIQANVAAETKAQCFSYPSPRTELHAAALWARDLILQDTSTRIAIVVPDGDARRAEIDRIFRRVLAPEQLAIADGDRPLPYEYSLGIPISRHPLTASALALLHWCVQPLPIEDVAALLRSPWLCISVEEHRSRLRFEMQMLRKSSSLLPEISFDQLLWLAQRNDATLLFHRLESLRKRLVLPQGALHTHTEWAALIHAALQESGWPGDNRLNSAEYQLFERWKALLDEFCRLDFCVSRIKLEDAISKLKLIADQSTFAPESENAPVQILGVLEAAGSKFDAIWFAGATELAWPQSGDPHPLLPWPLQRDLQMPHATAGDDYALALTMQQRILASAQRVVFSYYRENSDGAQSASPLLREASLDAISMSDESLPPIFTPHSLATEQVDAVGMLPPPPEMLHRGGAGLLKSQSLCAFRAFAEHRLHAAPPEPVEFGIDARDSGNVVHKILQYFWQEIKTQAALRALTVKEREDKLRALAAQELHHIIHPHSALENAALAVQLDSLVPLLLEWLEIEAERPPFTVHYTEESLKNTQIGPLQLSLRCDRIDTVDSGEVLIDYKTGSCTTADWGLPRPNEPQLPLYAIARESTEPDTPCAIAFARIRPGELALVGIQSDYGILKVPKLKADKTPRDDKSVINDMEQKISAWRTELTRLANDFHHGIPYVDPKKKFDTCKFCQQAVLCRVSELDFSGDEDDEVDEDEELTVQDE